MSDKNKQKLTKKEIEEIFGDWDNPTWQEVAAAEAKEQREKKSKKQ